MNKILSNGLISLLVTIFIAVPSFGSVPISYTPDPSIGFDFFGEPYFIFEDGERTGADEIILLMVDGSFISNAYLVMENGYALVPVRTVTEQLGAKVDWEDAEQIITITKDETTIKLRINEESAWVNERSYSLNAPAKIINEKTYVPLRFVSEVFGCKVDYDTTLLCRPIVSIQPLDSNETPLTKEAALTLFQNDLYANLDAGAQGYYTPDEDMNEEYQEHFIQFKMDANCFIVGTIGRYYIATARFIYSNYSVDHYALVDMYNQNVFYTGDGGIGDFYNLISE